MVHTVVLPKMGNTVKVCIVVQWLVDVGHSVSSGEPVCEVETDKSTLEVIADADGVLLAHLAAPGDEVAVQSPLYILGEPGEGLPADATQVGTAAPASAEVEAAVPESTHHARTRLTPPPPATPAVDKEVALNFSPRARTLAHRYGLPRHAIAVGTGPFGIATTHDVESAYESGPGLTRAAALSDKAETYDVNMAGWGIGGRVTADELNVSTANATAEAVAVQPSSDEQALTRSDAEYLETPIRGIRKIISERMVESLATAAQVTYQTSAPASALLALRARLKNSPPELGFAAITIGDLVAFAAARVALRHPAVNAHLVDGVLRSFRTVHLGLAVDAPRGLMVPTLTNASSLSLKDFSTRSKSLASACQTGAVTPDELTGATFTVSNLGSFEIEGFTPIVNLPQTAILGIGTIIPRAFTEPDGSVGIEDRLTLLLTADHRVIDGADAARYLQEVVSAVANIDTTVLM